MNSPERKHVSPAIAGAAGQQRTFLHVDDLVRGLQIVMKSGAAGEAYNIGGTEPVTIKELCHLVERAIGQDILVEYKPHFTPDHHGRRPDVSKVEALGWRAEVPVIDGLIRSFAAINEELSGWKQQSLA